MKRNKGTSYISNAFFLLKYSFKINKLFFVWKLFSIIITSFSAFVPLIFIRLITNEITVGRDMKKVIIYSIGFAASSLAVGLISHITNYQCGIQTEKTSCEMKRRLGVSVMNMPYSEVEQPKTKDFINLATGGNNFISVINNLSSIATSVITLVGLAAIITTLQPVIILLIVLTVAVRLFTDSRTRKIAVKYRELNTPVFRKMNYYNTVMADVTFGKEIRINKLQGWLLSKINDFLDSTVFRLTKKQYTETQRVNVLSELSVVIQECVVYLVLAYKVVFGGMLIGDFSMYMTSINNFSGCVRGLISGFSNLVNDGLYAKEFRNIVQNFKPEEMTDKGENIPDGAVKIEFRNVSFKYPNTDRYVLKNISFTIEPRETLSIVGVNGAGKTTLVKLICRFYEPTEGEILVGGIPINTIPYKEYTKILGVVFQDFRMFAFSVAENIALDAEYDKAALQNCIEESALADKISRLPDGINTYMFKEFSENGIEFSGGEAQKLAIARTLYKEPSLLILDEPTSALDPIAEYEIYQKFNELVQGRTAIYISHRLASTRFTDKIAVFSDGEMREYGSHGELMQLDDGIYKNMFEMQAQYYV